MNAIVSGRSARALILDGESLKSFDLDDPSEIVPRRRSDLPYLFGEAADLRILENTTIESVERELRMDCHFTWALDLTLISLDSELEDDIRKEALTGLEKLLADKATVVRVENVLYSEPLPEEADIKQALELCDDGALSTVVGFLRDLEARQSLIEKANQAWESIPTKTFGNHENRNVFKHIAVKEGLYRDLVTLSPIVFVVNACRNESVQQLHNYSQVLRAWMSSFRRSSETPDLITEDDDDTGAEVQQATQEEFEAAAVEVLMRKYDRPLRLTAGRILRIAMSPAMANVEADDIVQEVYLTLFIKGIKDIEESMGADLMSMVRNKALNRVRRRRVDVELDETLEDVDIDLEAEFEKTERLNRLERQIRGMSLEEQLILHLFIDGLSWKEMAKVLNISEPVARKRLFHARAKFSKKVKREYSKLDSPGKSQPAPHADEKGN